MTRIFLHRLLISSILLSVLACQTTSAKEVEPFQVHYELYRNGKLMGKVEVELKQQGETWVLTSETDGTHGLARLLAARDSEYAEGHMVKGRFRPVRYNRHTSMAGMDDEWSADFDWEAGMINVSKGQERSQLEIGARAFDPLSMGLELRRRLARNNPNLKFRLVKDDKIKIQQFRKLEPQRLETGLGCLETMPVERVRSNSKRYTRAWHAPELDYISVRLEHGKTGGNHLELRITELTLGDSVVTPGPGCAASKVHSPAG